MIITSRPDSPLQVITVDTPPHRPPASIENDIPMMDDEPNMGTDAGSSASGLHPLSSTPSQIEQEQSNDMEVDEDQRTRFFQMVSHFPLFPVLDGPTRLSRYPIPIHQTSLNSNRVTRAHPQDEVHFLFSFPRSPSVVRERRRR